MNRRIITASALFLILGAGVAHAQKILESAPLEVTPVKNAPFLGDAVTEFTQVLADGNRIEHRYVSSVARDSRGRTRREEQIALVGPLATAGAAPRLVTILDPDAGATYTLDEAQQLAYRNRMLNFKVASVAAAAKARVTIAAAPIKDPAASKVVTESLGAKPMEGGITAQGTRTTTTIPAGAIGNVLPIDIVSERWVSPELQMPVLIRRNDPRSGETVYRLTNIVRTEPADALFAVPSGYEVREGKLAFRLVEKAKALAQPKKK